MKSLDLTVKHNDRQMKVLHAFTDGSCINGGVNFTGKAGWASVWVIGSKLFKEFGKGYLNASSSDMEEKALINTLKEWDFREDVQFTVTTDYLNILGSLENIFGGNAKYEANCTKELRKILSNNGIKFDRFNAQKIRDVTSKCGRLRVKWVKAHTQDKISVDNVDSMEVLANRRADQIAKSYATSVKVVA